MAQTEAVRARHTLTQRITGRREYGWRSLAEGEKLARRRAIQGDQPG